MEWFQGLVSRSGGRMGLEGMSGVKRGRENENIVF